MTDAALNRLVAEFMGWRCYEFVYRYEDGEQKCVEWTRPPRSSGSEPPDYLTDANAWFGEHGVHARIEAEGLADGWGLALQVALCPTRSECAEWWRWAYLTVKSRQRAEALGRVLKERA